MIGWALLVAESREGKGWLSITHYVTDGWQEGWAKRPTDSEQREAGEG